jgi:ribosome-associated protein
MKTVKLRAEDDFIKLGQALKKAGMEDSGVDAKYDIQNGLVKVNGETDTRRGRKLVDGDVVEYNGEQVKIEK